MKAKQTTPKHLDWDNEHRKVKVLHMIQKKIHGFPEELEGTGQTWPSAHSLFSLGAEGHFVYNQEGLSLETQ